MPLATFAEVIAAIALFAVLALALAWAAHQTRRLGAARARKLDQAPLRRRAF
jgi:hypothetical protein